MSALAQRAELHVSASSLRQLESCPRAWGYRYFAGHPAEDVAAGLILGRACHVALAHWFERLRDGGPDASIDEMLGAAHLVIGEAERDTKPVFNPDEIDLRSEAERLLGAFMVKPLRPHRVIAVERPFSVRVEHHPTTGEAYDFEEAITGAIDLLVEEPDGALGVIDHKIGKRAPSIEAGFDLQLALYAWAVEQMFETSQSVRIFHHVLIRTKVPRVELVQIPRTPHDAEEALEAAASGVALIHAAVEHPTPMRLLGRRRSWKCDGCCFRARCGEDRT